MKSAPRWSMYLTASLFVLLFIFLIASGPFAALDKTFSSLQKKSFLASAIGSTPAVAQIAPNTVKDALMQKGIYFGTYLSGADIRQDPPRPSNYLDTISQYSDVYTVPVYWSTVEASQGKFNFVAADQIADFAKAHGAKIRIHNLVWHDNIPAWVTSTSNLSNPNQLSAILKNHVQTIVSHFAQKYPGEAIAIDVVNEPIRNCNDPINCNSDGVRKDFWRIIHKPGSTDDTDYIQLAFQWAHEADPTAILYLNDDHLESNPAENASMLALVKRLQAAGTSISGVGMESHVAINENTPEQTIESVMNSYTALGLQVQITEFDAMFGSYLDPTLPALPLTDDNLAIQASQTQKFLTACMNVRNCNAFVSWGLWDTVSWRNVQWPTNPGPFYSDLLDSNLKQKPSFIAMASLFNTSSVATTSTSHIGLPAPLPTSTDLTTPTFSLKGNNPLYIDEGSPFTDPGAIASDNTYGDLTDQVVTSGSVDTTTPGTYTITYNVSDTAGNPATTTRTVIVQAPTPSTPLPYASGLSAPGVIESTNQSITAPSTSIIEFHVDRAPIPHTSVPKVSSSKTPIISTPSITSVVYQVNGTTIHTTSTFPDTWNLDTSSVSRTGYTLTALYHYDDGSTRSSATVVFPVQPKRSFFQSIGDVLKGVWEGVREVWGR